MKIKILQTIFLFFIISLSTISFAERKTGDNLFRNESISCEGLPFNAKLYCKSAVFWIANNDLGKSIEYLKKCIDISPEFEEGKHKLSILIKIKKEQDRRYQLKLRADAREKARIAEERQIVLQQRVERRKKLREEKRRKAERKKKKEDEFFRKLAAQQRIRQEECAATKYSYDRVCFDGCMAHFVLNN